MQSRGEQSKQRSSKVQRALGQRTADEKGGAKASRNVLGWTGPKYSLLSHEARWATTPRATKLPELQKKPTSWKIASWYPRPSGSPLHPGEEKGLFGAVTRTLR